MSEGQQKHVTTLVIQPGGGTTSGDMVVATTGSSSMSMQSSSKFSSSSQQSSSSSTSSSSTGATSTKTTKTVSSKTTTSKTTKSSSTMMKSSSYMSSSSRTLSIKSNTSSFSDSFGKDMGIDVESEMKKLMSGADTEVRSIREKFFNLQPLALMSGDKSGELIKLDSSSVNNYIDKAHNDRLKFNFDVNEFESESISVKCDGNKMEVHAMKKSKKGDEEASEEYSRTYELPTSSSVNPDSVTTSFYKDGILTVELPVSEAIESK